MRDFYNEKLDNGMTLMAYPMPTAHSATIMLYLKGGAYWETKSETGVTHMVEHLCFRRCEGIAQRDFFIKIGGIGGFLDGVTFRDHVVFSINVHPAFLKEAAKIIASLFSVNNWTREDIRREKEVVFRQIEGECYSFRENVYNTYFASDGKGKPMMGTVSDVRRLAKPLLEAWKTRLFSPADCAVIVSGAFNDSDLETVQHQLSGLRNVSDREYIAHPLPKNFLHRSGADDSLHRDDYHSTEIGLMFDIDKSRTSFELDLIRDAVSAGMYAPLSMLLREECGILDEIPTLWDLYEFGGNLLFTFEVENKRTDLLMDHLAEQFAKMKAGLDRVAFDCAKAFFTKTRAALLRDYPEDYAQLLGDYAFLKGERFDTLESYIGRYEEITYEQLCGAANSIFSAENLSITAVTDTKKYSARKMNKKMAAIRKSLAFTD
jgi:processing peptidase subunit beta